MAAYGPRKLPSNPFITDQTPTHQPYPSFILLNQEILEEKKLSNQKIKSITKSANY